MMEHKYPLGGIVRESCYPGTPKSTKGIIIRRLWFFSTNPTSPDPDTAAILEPAYFVRFTDGRELKLGENELTMIDAMKGY